MPRPKPVVYTVAEGPSEQASAELSAGIERLLAIANLSQCPDSIIAAAAHYDPVLIEGLKSFATVLDRALTAISERPEVMECYLMTGDADYLLRVVLPDVAALERFILERLTKMPGKPSFCQSSLTRRST